ncbi:MAG: efflux RND transporter periplasmic adaptor subunit [Bacteroidaceae bacterium]|nr:efflux RND transporter periplasmic adaptor subunit [Bacteroidaceae bacterium]MBR1791237.1 efflux RND transporter periplasmic adaptor subunit [Bacteroidaceae bacterium]
MIIRLSLKHILWCALLVAVIGCGEQAPSSATQHYETLTVARQDYTQSRKFMARIESQQRITIRPVVGGILTKVYVSEGAQVRKGDPMFIIDQAPYIAAVDEAQAQLSTARATLSTAELNLRGKEQLFAQQMVGEFDLQRARHAKEEAAAQVEAAQAQLARARTDLGYTTITSPAYGRLGIINFREGQFIDPAMELPMATLSANSHIYAYTSLSEKQLDDLYDDYGCCSSQELLGKLPAVALQTTWGDELPQKGSIDAVSGSADLVTGTVLIRASFENTPELFRNGSNGYLVLPSTLRGVFIIPQEATTHIQDKYFVYRVVEGKAVSTEVTGMAADDDEYFVVTSGLADGDVIIAEGVGLVREGATVAQEKK